ncbi:carbohydrate ABC transporter permease [Cohnella herbarum]|uniref:Carbohydrate ABC transporter permease n=1 Tax=Cohnella herbarum TaxID=2728023 RepID=A0A7Z2ZN74_9BACL|nr:carbohydrate ABC transporter permease [Cohnella herbarum]QJD85913.1 carbohydrate ABC transporter permease [Cohnella herbarum]
MKPALKQTLICIPLAIFGSFMAFPFIWMLLSSIKSAEEIITVPITWFPGHPQWHNYKDIWSVIPLGNMYVNSLIVTVLIVIGVLLTSSMAGFALAKYRFKGREVVFMLILSTMMIPFFVLFIPLFFIIKEFGWINSYAGLIVPNIVTAFGIFLMRQFTSGIPDEMIQAARIDGASEWRVYWKMILPLQKQALAALAIFSFVYQWDSFLWPLVVVSDEGMNTLPLGINMLRNAYSSQANMNMMMTGSTIIVVPSLLVFVLLQRYFIKGITMTGMKG